MLINSRPVMRTGPEVPQEASLLPVPPPPPRPVINFTTNCSPHHAGCEVPQEASPLPVPPPPPRPVINFTTNCSPHHAGCEASNFTNTHVPFIATARATPGT